jgi:hypothetical protein
MSYRYIFCLFFSFILETVYCQPDIGYRLINSQKVESKNFYFLSLVQYFNDAETILRNDKDLSDLACRKHNELNASENPLDMLNALRFTENEITTVSKRLKALYQSDNALGKLVSQHLIPSGCYYKFQDLPARDLIVKAWEQDAKGINHVIDIFGEGQKPRFPNIDSMSFVRGSTRHYFFVSESKKYLIELSKNNNRFFMIPLQAALFFLDINDRNESIDFEPLTETVNKKCYEYIRTLDWSKYKYSVMVVLGAGPDNYRFPLSPDGKLRLKMLSIRYHQGYAPLILLSGGRVHPYKTPHIEAYNMKKYLVEECGIPEFVIMIDPHARHTTTNIRNSVRIMFRQGIPMDKNALISSLEHHINYVADKTFITRCQNEMGLVPYELGERLTSDLIEFYPKVVALHINPIGDPLDP